MPNCRCKQVSGLADLAETLPFFAVGPALGCGSCMQLHQLFLDLEGMGIVIKSMGTHLTDSSVQTQALKVIAQCNREIK